MKAHPCRPALKDTVPFSGTPAKEKGHIKSSVCQSLDGGYSRTDQACPALHRQHQGLGSLQADRLSLLEVAALQQGEQLRSSTFGVCRQQSLPLSGPLDSLLSSPTPQKGTTPFKTANTVPGAGHNG